jgi:glycosyltransferase involved in cell wall biosynthesis
MKILYVITRSDVFGGASTHLRDLVAHASLQGVDASVLIGGTGEVYEHFLSKGFQVYTSPHLRREFNIISDFLFLLDLLRIVKQVKPGVVHSHSFKAGFLVRLAYPFLKYQVKFVHTAHGWPFSSGIPSVATRFLGAVIELICSWLCDSIICVCNVDRIAARRIPFFNYRKISVVHNGIPASENFHDRANPSAVRNKNKVVFVSVARLDDQKNHASLISAFSSLNRDDWRLILVGDGPRRVTLIELVSSLELTANIVFLGRRNDVDDILSLANCFVLCSNWEGFPISIIEAMRSGLPVISSNVGGVSEAVSHLDSGLLVQPSDTEGLASAIRFIMDNPALSIEFGARGLHIYRGSFTIEKMWSRTLEVYNEVLMS